MSRLRVALLANPAAASGSSQRAGHETARLLRQAGISTVDVSGPTPQIARARAMAIRDDLTALIVVGGDGTVALGAGITADTPIRLGVVAVGSGNDFARALGLPVRDVEASVAQILHALSRPAHAIDAIALSPVVTEGTPRRSIVLGNVSVGFDAFVNARANRARGGGAPKYVSGVLRELPRFRPIPYWLEIDGGARLEFDASILTIANTGVFGGGMSLAPEARLDDGLLDVVRVSGLNRAQLLRLFPRVYRGTHTALPAFSTTPATHVRIGIRDGSALRAYADGEPRSLLPIDARVMPGAVRVLADPPSHGTAGSKAHS